MCRSSRSEYTEVRAQRRERPADPDMRVSDADRDRVVDLLRDHAAAGRLAPDELEERIEVALAARTAGELDALLTDLPGSPEVRREHRRTPEARREAARRAFAEHLRTYVMVMVLLVAIWALTGMGYFWPIWPALGWGIGIWCHAASTPRRRGRFGVARV
jgi:hypothetical protein